MTKNTRILINNETEYERAMNTLFIIHKVNNCRPQNNRLHFEQKKSIYSNENDFLISRRFVFASKKTITNMDTTTK